MIGLLLFVPGLILLIALPSLFAGAAAVGLILTLIGGGILVFQLLIFAFAAKQVSKVHKSFDRDRDWFGRP